MRKRTVKTDQARLTGAVLDEPIYWKITWCSIQGRLNYRKRLAAGLAIGSDQVEGACQDDCKVPGTLQASGQ